MTLKFDMVMSCNGQNWSETHYYLNASSVPQPNGFFDALMELRCACLGKGAQGVSWTLSNVPGNRLTQDRYVFGSSFQGSWPADPTGLLYAASLPDNAFLIDMSAPSLFLAPPKRLYLACPPAKVLTTLSGNPADTEYDSAFFVQLQEYMGALTGNTNPNTSATNPQSTWGYRYRNKANVAPAIGIPVTNVNFPNAVGIQVAAALPGIGMAPGQSQEVYLTGWRRINTHVPGLEGAFTVSGILPPTSPATTPWTYFLLNSGNVSPTNFKGLGSIAPLTFGYAEYGPYWSPAKYARRKRGVRIGGRRGRSPARH